MIAPQRFQKLRSLVLQKEQRRVEDSGMCKQRARPTRRFLGAIYSVRPQLARNLAQHLHSGRAILQHAREQQPNTVPNVDSAYHPEESYRFRRGSNDDQKTG
jgi:hypothetical protein